MNETERNKILFILLEKLSKEKDFDSINLIETFIMNETLSIKKTFEIMTKDLDYVRTNT